MEQLSAEEKSDKITFTTTPTMRNEIDTLMKKNRWKRSAFIRVCIQKELDRLKAEK